MLSMDDDTRGAGGAESRVTPWPERPRRSRGPACRAVPQAAGAPAHARGGGVDAPAGAHGQVLGVPRRVERPHAGVLEPAGHAHRVVAPVLGPRGLLTPGDVAHGPQRADERDAAAPQPQRRLARGTDDL